MTRRSIRLAIMLAVLALVATLANRVWAAPSESSRSLDSIVRTRLAPSIPAGLDIAKIYFPPDLADASADPAKVIVELPRELRAGRQSIKLSVRGRRTLWVPVAIAAVSEVAVAQRELASGAVIGADDIAFERRAVAEVAAAAPQTVVGGSVVNPIAAGAVVAARDVSLPPPLSRGTQITVDVRRGAVHVRGTGILETAARPGELASARLAATKLVVHGRLVAPATLIVGE